MEPMEVKQRYAGTTIEFNLLLPTYLEQIEKFLLELEGTIRNNFKDYPEPVQSEYTGFYMHEFKRTHRYSFVVHTYSRLERILRDSCNDCGHLKKSRIRFGDLYPTNPIDRTQKYAEKVAGYRGKIPGELETPVRHLAKIRHCIVHHGGDITSFDGKKKLKQLSGDIPGYSTHKEGRIDLEEQFCEWAIDVARKFYFEFVQPVLIEPYLD